MNYTADHLVVHLTAAVTTLNFHHDLVIPAGKMLRLRSWTWRSLTTATDTVFVLTSPDNSFPLPQNASNVDGIQGNCICLPQPSPTTASSGVVLATPIPWHWARVIKQQSRVVLRNLSGNLVTFDNATDFLTLYFEIY